MSRQYLLVGMNDMLFMDAIAPALTTISTPTAELGTQASHILIAMIKGTPVQNDRIVLTPVLLARDSVAAIKLPTRTRSSDFSDAAKREARIRSRQS